jgi:aminocarboxymuconate-semialdehyde decarboxylase
LSSTALAREVVVDAHAHVIVPGLGAAVEWHDGTQVVSFAGTELRSAQREFSELARILEEQDRAGVDVVVLAPWVNLCGVEVDRQNAALADLACERVALLGTVDPTNPDQLVELMGDGRFVGVELPTAWGGVYLGDDRFEPFWAAAEETGALVFVHPSTRLDALPVLDQHYLWNTVGNPFETTVAGAHMIAAGVLDRHPSVNVLLAHGGGGLASLRGRLAREQSIHPPGRDVRSAIRRFFVDTVVHDADVLRGLIDFFGPERVLLGSDYPFDMGDERPVETVRRLDLDAGVERSILGENALRLIARAGP